MRIIDFHTHVFPDSLARKAIPALEKEGNIKACLNGTAADLIGSMDKAGITASVVASIATRPEQFSSILAWSESIASPRLVPFPSFHPADPEALRRIDEIAGRGFKGVKLHPYYQDFIIDDEDLFPLYDSMERLGLILLIHAGYDMAFTRVPRATPERSWNVLRRFPGLKMVVTHLGGWEDWDDAARFIIGREIYIEVSVSVSAEENPRARDMIMAHPEDYVLFGSDSPWVSQADTVNRIREMGFPPGRERKLFYGNAERLFGD